MSFQSIIVTFFVTFGLNITVDYFANIQLGSSTDFVIFLGILLAFIAGRLFTSYEVYSS